MACDVCVSNASAIWYVVIGTYAIVFGVNVEEADLLDVVASRVLGKAGDVNDAETRGIVGLVGKTLESLWSISILQAWQHDII